MLIYEIKLVYELSHPSYPSFAWKQENEPNENDMLDIVLQYAEKYNVPIDVLEEQAVLFVDSCEDGKFSDLEVYGINFQEHEKH